MITAKNLEALYDFLTDMFMNPAVNFKVHKFNEGTVDIPRMPQGVDVNLSNMYGKLSRKVINDCYRDKQVLSFSSVSFSPGLTATTANVKKIFAIVVDIDKKINKDLIKSLSIKPHYVFSRGDKYHIYWLINPVNATNLNVKKFTEVSRYFTHYFSGDPNSIKLAKIMRLPYTSHQKKTKSFYKLDEHNDLLDRYNLNDLYDTIEPFIQDLKESISNEKVLSIIEKVLSEHGIVEEGQGRTVFLYFVSNLCYDWGLPIEEAKILVHKYNQDLCVPPESNEHVNDQVEKTYSYSNKDLGNKLSSYEELKTENQKRQKIASELLIGRLKNFFSNWVYVSQLEFFINIDTGLRYTTKQQINAYLMGLFGCKDGYTITLSNNLIFQADKITIDPSQDKVIFKKDSIIYFNEFKKFKHPEPINLELCTKKVLKRYQKSCKIFEGHLSYLVPNKTERELLIDWLSFIVQHNGKKVMWAPLIISEHRGVGKSSLAYLMKKIFGEGLREVENSVLDKSETDYLINTNLMVVHELNQGFKYSVMNKFKTIITDPTVSIVAKWARTYEQPNITNLLLFANSIGDSLAIEQRDRRIFPVYHTDAPKSSKYYDTLFNTFNNNWHDIYSYFMHRDLERFNPYKAPLETDVKKAMQNLSKSGVESYLDSLYEMREAPFNNPIVIPAVALKIITAKTKGLNLKLSQINVSKFLLSKGYSERVVRWKSAKGPKTIRVWSDNWVNVDKLLKKDKNHLNKYIGIVFNSNSNIL